MCQDRKVKIGIVGAKFAAELHLIAYSRCSAADVIAICDKDPERMKEYAKRFSIPKMYSTYQEMMQDSEIELISICVPNFLHYEVAMAACAAGKHVICEKPLATTLENAIEMVNAFRQKGLRLMHGEDWNFAPAIQRAKEIIDEGAIGDILYIKAKETHNGSHSPFAQTLEFCGGGAFLHVGIHPAGFVRFITGHEVVEVIAKTSPGLKGNLVHQGMEGEDWGAAILTLDNGTYAFIEGNYITLGGMDDRIEIYGTKGSLHLNLTMGNPLNVYSETGYKYVVEKADISKGWTRPAVDEFYSLGYQTEIDTFVKSIRDRTPVPAGGSGEDGLAALAIIKAAYISAQEKRPVNPLQLWKERISDGKDSN